jgi:nitrogen fixation protein
VQLLRSLNKDIVVVPDQDVAGMALVDRALELGWSVSMPEWPADCKDINDAVIRMGQVATLITILAARETSRVKIQLQKKKLMRQLRGNNAKGI